MNKKRKSGGGILADPMRVQAGLLAVALLVAPGGPAAAQTVPYQYSQRSQIGSGIGQMQLPRGGVFQPRIESSLQYGANLNLVTEEELQIDMASIELAPGFYSSYSSGVVVAAIDYSLIGRAWEDSDYNDVTHRLSANGEWIAIPEWFAVRGQAEYGDAVIDQTAGLNYLGAGAFGASNLAEYATAGFSPTLRHGFNELEFAATYNYSRVWYLDEGKGVAVPAVGGEDSTDQSADVSFGSANLESIVSARLFYEWQKSEYDTAVPFEFERAGIDAGLQVSRAIAIVGDFGKESEPGLLIMAGGLDSDFWSAGFRWTPSERSSAEARFGNRFFGDTYYFDASHRARLLQFRASYSEQPTVETQRISQTDFTPGELPPDLPDVDDALYNFASFVATDARASVTAVGARTTAWLTLYQNERDYLFAVQTDETERGAEVGVTRNVASNLTADLSMYFRNFDREGTDTLPSADDRDFQVTFRLNRRAGASLTLTGETAYLKRSGDLEYDGWWIALRARYEP